MGWLQEKPTVSNRITSVITLAAITIPFLFALNAVLMGVGFIDSSRSIFTPLQTGGLIFLWLCLSLYQGFTIQRRRSTILVHFILYYVIASSFILLSSGFNSPTTYTWIVLAFATHIYFGMRGLIISIVTVGLVGLTDALLYGDFHQVIGTNIIEFGAVAIISVIAIMTMRRERVDQRELDESMHQLSVHSNRLHALLNNLTTSVMSVDKHCRVTSYNAATLSLLDTNKELEHQAIDNVVQLYAAGDKPVSLKGVLRKTMSVTKRDDLYLKYGDDRIRIELNISPVKGTFLSGKEKDKHELSGYIIMMSDITKQKSLDEEKDEFISVVSHELRTPITIAEGTLDNILVMLKRNIADKKVLSSTIETAHKQVVFLAKMVNDLSTLSRAERGVADQPEIIDVEKLMHELYAQYSPQAEEKGLAFNLNAKGNLGRVKTSPLYLKELLQNFITNAIKYTKEGSITFSAIREANEDITFSVKDTGIGISKSDVEHVFEKFYRSEDYRTRETGGTGLGLYVAQKLAKKIGTWIDVKSKLNHGSTFAITIPTLKNNDESENTLDDSAPEA